MLQTRHGVPNPLLNPRHYVYLTAFSFNNIKAHESGNYNGRLEPIRPVRAFFCIMPYLSSSVVAKNEICG